MFTNMLAFIRTFTTLTVTSKAMAGCWLVLPHLAYITHGSDGTEKAGPLFPVEYPHSRFTLHHKRFHMFAYWPQWTPILTFSWDLSHTPQTVKVHEHGLTRRHKLNEKQAVNALLDIYTQSELTQMFSCCSHVTLRVRIQQV